MLGANIVRASLLAVLVLAVMLHAGSIWALYVVALCTGVAEPIYDTGTIDPAAGRAAATNCRAPVRVRVDCQRVRRPAPGRLPRGGRRSHRLCGAGSPVDCRGGGAAGAGFTTF
jgi:hypothetical protein